MLPPPTLPASLANLRWAFIAPTFAAFGALETWLTANTGNGAVTGMLTSAGLSCIGKSARSLPGQGAGQSEGGE